MLPPNRLDAGGAVDVDDRRNAVLPFRANMLGAQHERRFVLADENIPYVREVFSHFSEVRTLSGRKITAETLEDAQILLVRSITKVNEELLKKSKVRFVATATIGFDHVDTEYLGKKGIAFASAPGSNATSVAEYIVSALLNLGYPPARAREALALVRQQAGAEGFAVMRLEELLRQPLRALV